MCEFFSGLCYKAGNVFWSEETDQHDEMIAEQKLDDKKPLIDRNWIRFEITPLDCDNFNHKIGNWELKVDEQSKPDWFGVKHEKACYNALKEAFKKVFLINKKTDRIEFGRFFISGGTIKYVGGSAIIKYVGDSAIIEDVGGSAIIEDVRGSAIIEDVGGSAIIKYVGGSAIIKYVGGSAIIKYVGDSAIIEDVRDSATITVYQASAKILKQEDESVIIQRFYGQPAKVIYKNKELQ